MTNDEKDPQSKLFEQLDRRLVWNASALGRATEIDVDTVYGLEALIEWHRYLKTEHSFAPGEAEALLDFQDPLSVTQICWVENRFESGFSICDILDDINAYERFDLTWEAQKKRCAPQVQQLKERLDKNYADYTAAMLSKSKQELIEQSESIAITRTAYAYMKDDFEYEHHEAALLLKLDNPLGYLASRWPLGFDDTGNDDGVIQEVISDLDNPEYLQTIQQASVAVQPEKPSLRGQLQAAVQEVGQRQPQDGQAKRQQDTPNL